MIGRKTAALTLMGGALTTAFLLEGPLSAWGSSQTPAATTAPAVYQGKLINAHLLLGAQSSPTSVVKTSALPAGTYLVNYSIGVVMDGSDGSVCAATPTSKGNQNDGIFGGTGNGSSASGVYGNAISTDVIKIATAGDSIHVVCNRTNAGGSVYVGSASLTALKVRVGS